MILNRIKLAVDRTIAAFSVVVMIALVVCVVWQVFSRYVLNQPSTLTDELGAFLNDLGRATGCGLYRRRPASSGDRFTYADASLPASRHCSASLSICLSFCLLAQ
ncbi:TRAP-type transport system [Klebsiella pneumoniae]|uniref:TRAP-type transport system n=1 Tax=Klebsiella pneumoniae TaxID=573 RepID=A0A378AA29_KLEPN|nr:TRAP-type transport system [Klebsiella pneumoniae]